MTDSPSFKTGNKYRDSNGGKWRVIQQIHRGDRYVMLVCRRLCGLKMVYAVAISNDDGTATIILSRYSRLIIYPNE